MGGARLSTLQRSLRGLCGPGIRLTTEWTEAILSQRIAVDPPQIVRDLCAEIGQMSQTPPMGEGLLTDTAADSSHESVGRVPAADSLRYYSIFQCVNRQAARGHWLSRRREVFSEQQQHQPAQRMHPSPPSLSDAQPAEW